MNSDTSKNSKPQCGIDSKSCPYTETVKKCVNKNGYPCNQNDMIEVLMWIFMCVIMVVMIMCVRGKYFFEKVDSEKTSNKHIDRMSILFHRFRENMDECH